MSQSNQVRYKIINTFHNTEARFLAPFHHDGAYAAYIQLVETTFSAHRDSEEYIKANRKLGRIWRKLCGISGCMCGGMIKAGV